MHIIHIFLCMCMLFLFHDKRLLFQILHLTKYATNISWILFEKKLQLHCTWQSCFMYIKCPPTLLIYRHSWCIFCYYKLSWCTPLLQTFIIYPHVTDIPSWYTVKLQILPVTSLRADILGVHSNYRHSWCPPLCQTFLGCPLLILQIIHNSGVSSSTL